MEPIERLRSSNLFEHFSDEQIEQLARCTSLVRYPEGTLVIKEGDMTHDAYVIDSGTIRIQRDTPYGVYQLADLGEGDMFGETSFVDQSARSGDALVIEASAVLPLNAVALRSLEEDQRFTLALYWTFWKSLSVKLRKTNEHLAHFFSSESAPPTQGASAAEGTAEFRVGIAAKKDLFQEQKLSPLEINFLSTLSKERRLAGGEVLFHEGEEGKDLYVVLDGRVMISKNIAGAGEEALGFIERGDYFGEMALIDDQPRSADAKADENGAVVLAIPSGVLERILDMKKVSSIRLLKILCGLVAKRLREIDDKLVGWFIFSGGSGNSLELPDL